MDVLDTLPKDRGVCDAITHADQYPFDGLEPDRLTGEDLLAFMMGIGNAHVNRPDAVFIDNIPAADADLLGAAQVGE